MAEDRGFLEKLLKPTKEEKEDVKKKLEQAFLAGCTDVEACCYADISRSTLHNYCESNDGFMDRKETLKNQPVMQARFIVNRHLDEGDLATANRVIDRKEGQKIVQENINVELTHEQWLDGLK